jgi:hypothetical protein
MRIKEKYWGKVLWGLLAIILLCFIIFSCSVQESLTEPDPNDLVIIHIEDNYVFAVPACEVKPIYWPKADTLKVWSVLIEED